MSSSSGKRKLGKTNAQTDVSSAKNNVSAKEQPTMVNPPSATIDTAPKTEMLKFPDSHYKLNENFLRKLIHTPISSISVGQVYFVNKFDQASLAFQDLMAMGFLSFPVLQKTGHAWCGFVTIEDVVHFYLDHLPPKQEPSAEFSFPTEKTVYDIMSPQRTFPTTSHPLSPRYSILFALELFVKEKNLKRVAIIDPERKVVGLLTQSKVVRFLNDHFYELGTIKDLPIHVIKRNMRPIVSISSSDTALEGFQLARQRGITGVGIVNSVGELIGHLSYRDMRVLGRKGQFFQLLQLPVMEYLSYLYPKVASREIPEGSEDVDKRQRIVTVTLYDTFETALRRLVENNVHQAYIVDETDRPLGVVDCHDILKAVVNFS
eukprot:Lithocolla_globosa_v1_NODE_418_length_4113_cov_48.143420.p2 type:complete len:375 gc:universal NODE_418_length_4113_cov_48.143420:2860-3984(+)